MNIAARLHEKVAAVAPVEGVSVGKPEDKATWSVQFKDAATSQQKVAAQTIIDGFTFDAVTEGPLQDQDTLNAVLSEQGSVDRAGLTLLFRVMKGDIPVNPSLTMAGFKNLLRAEMRTGGGG